jgi:circadian clock protein KaiB
MAHSGTTGLDDDISLCIHVTAATEEQTSYGTEEYLLHLYIAGMSPKSVQAVKHIRTICTNYLDGRCQLKIIDIFQQPHLAKEAQIIALPTLVRVQPLPETRLIGDLSEIGKILHRLGLC